MFNERKTSHRLFSIESALIWKRLLSGLLLFARYGTLRKLLNLILVEGERKLRRPIIKGRPYFLKIDTTNICNAGCVYCLEKNPDYPAGKMSFIDFRRVIDINKDYTCLAALHFSGDPLLNEHIHDMIHYAHINRVATYLSTSLQDLKKEDAQKLIRSGLDLLTVSIDGATSLTYKRYRKNGDLDIVLDNIKALVAAKKDLKQQRPIITIQFMVMEHNEHEIPLIKKIASDLGVDNLEFKPIGIGDGTKHLLPGNPGLIRRIYRDPAVKRQPCWWLWASFVVLWNGDFTPCCFYGTAKPAGNLLEKDIQELKNSSLYQNLRKTVCLDVSQGVGHCVNCTIPYGNLINQTL
jgi:MoaA/NifB/PqqE/SkfB family radical SAM enzyme